MPIRQGAERRDSCARCRSHPPGRGPTLALPGAHEGSGRHNGRSVAFLGQDAAGDIADRPVHIAGRLHREREALNLARRLFEHVVQATDVLALDLALAENLVTDEVERTISTAKD